MADDEARNTYTNQTINETATHKERYMERKTKVDATDGAQELLITREFDLPVDLLFKAYTVP